MLLSKKILAILSQNQSLTPSKNSGFVLPMAVALGTIMLMLAVTSLLVAQSDRSNAVLRRTSGASMLVSDGAISRALLELSKPNNGVLLIRNYDPIDPKTGKNYLGADGNAKSGDESGNALDEWTGYNPTGAPCFQQLGRGTPDIAIAGVIGPNESYTIRAYRYDEAKKLGTLLVEGNYKGLSSLVAVSFTVEPILNDFPGLYLNNNSGNSETGKLALRNRAILGQKGNIYYSPLGSADPSLTGISAPGDSTRSSYLNAVWSSPSDGASGDTAAGKLFACRLTASVPVIPQGTNLSNITTSQTLSGSSGGITYYQVQKINLINNQTLTVDTTAGPVYLYISGGWNSVILRNSAKILNVRTDGQSPQVGDFRIMSSGDDLIHLFDNSCIQNAFIYLPQDQIELYTTGAGCPGGRNTNFEGVAWVEEILFSKNATSNRDVALAWQNTQNTTVIPNATSGISVPDDVSSLSDLLKYINWPARYRYGTIKSWRRVN
jgi:hypothetical protein